MALKLNGAVFLTYLAISTQIFKTFLFGLISLACWYDSFYLPLNSFLAGLFTFWAAGFTIMTIVSGRKLFKSQLRS